MLSQRLIWTCCKKFFCKNDETVINSDFVVVVICSFKILYPCTNKTRKMKNVCKQMITIRIMMTFTDDSSTKCVVCEFGSQFNDRHVHDVLYEVQCCN